MDFEKEDRKSLEYYEMKRILGEPFSEIESQLEQEILTRLNIKNLQELYLS